MTDDPIVNEVRAIRDGIAKEYNYDIEAIFNALRAMEVNSGREHVSQPPRRVTATTANFGAAQPGVAADDRLPRSARSPARR